MGHDDNDVRTQIEIVISCYSPMRTIFINGICYFYLCNDEIYVNVDIKNVQVISQQMPADTE